MQFTRTRALQNVATRAISSSLREVASPTGNVAALTEQAVTATSVASRVLPSFPLPTRSSATLPLVQATRSTQGYNFNTPWSSRRGFRGTALSALEFEIKAPFLSDQVPIANGHLGEVEEICYQVGDVVDEGDSVVILETHKASLHIKAEKHDKIKITAVLVEEGQDIYELQPVIKCVPA
mmetsp:Transcript_8505/g.17632  ORF Transcript_8505/g.17632 Transcript_8505/m.17632 type:complete len:180 (-) Transcript_8505:1522-2061(-)